MAEKLTDTFGVLDDPFRKKAAGEVEAVVLVLDGTRGDSVRQGDLRGIAGPSALAGDVDVQDTVRLGGVQDACWEMG